MAGGNDTVTTIFGGDDSNFQAAARKVKESVVGLAAFSSPMAFFKEAEKGAQGLHAASMQAKAGVDSLKAALQPLIAMGAALVGVATIFDGIKRSIELAAKVETAEFHLAAIAGGADKAAASIKRLHEIGDETALGFGTLAEGSEKLQEAGQSADQAADSMERLGKISLNSGSDLGELESIFARVLTKADVSSKDLVKLAMTGIPGMAAISQQFKAAEQSTAAWDKEIDKTIANLNKMFEASEKQTGAVNSFGSKIGLMQASFAQWAKTGGSAINGLVKSLDGVSEAGIGKMSGTFGKEFTEGLQQIETETGLSGAALRKFMQEGKLGYDELISAAGRFREEQHKAETAAGEAQKLANENALLAQQKGLLDKVRAAIETATSKGGIFATVDEFFHTFNGKWQQVQHSIDGMFHTFGVPLMDALKPALDHLTAFFSGEGKQAAAQWGGYLGGLINHAMLGLEHGNWAPLEKDGETAFAAILKAASQGIDDLGIVLQTMMQGPGMGKAIAGLTKMLIGAANAFGEAMMQSASAPLRKIEALDIAVMPGVRNIIAARNTADFNKFTPEQKQQFTEQGGGQNANALDEVTGGNIAKDADVIASIKGFAGVMDHVKEAGAGLTQAVQGFAQTVQESGTKIAKKDGTVDAAGIDTEDTWARKHKVGIYAEPKTAAPAAPATAAPPEEANRDATTTIQSPLANAAVVGPASTQTGLSPFTPDSFGGARKAEREEEKAQSARERFGAEAKANLAAQNESPWGAHQIGDDHIGPFTKLGAPGSPFQKMGSAGDTSIWGPNRDQTSMGRLPREGSNDGGGLRALTQKHYDEMQGMGMAPIGDNLPNMPTSGPGSPNFSESGVFQGTKPGRSKFDGQGFSGWMDASGVEHSNTGAIGPGGAQPWQAPPPMTDHSNPHPPGGAQWGQQEGPAVTAIPGAPASASGAGANAGPNTAELFGRLMDRLESILTALNDDNKLFERVFE